MLRAEDRALDRHRGDAGRRGRQYGTGLEAPQNLLEDEEHAAERCVERGGKARAGTRSEQRGPLVAHRPNARGEQRAKGRAHLHGRSFAPERQAAADREQTAEELDGNDACGCRGHLAAEHRDDVRNAATRGERREATHEPGGDASDDTERRADE